MPRNGSGTYSLPAGNPVVTGTTISSTTHNSTMSDIATALTSSIAKDGQTVPTANLPMATYRHTGVGAAVSLTDYARTDQVQNSAFTTLSSVSGTNTITASATPAPSSYSVGQSFEFVPANTNSGATTLNVSGLGAGAIQSNGSALVGGELKQNVPIRVKVTAATPVFEIIGNGATSSPVDVVVHAATSKATPVDSDEIPLIDSAAGWGLKKLTWANLKATLKSYFDTIYSTLTIASTAEAQAGTNNTKAITPLRFVEALQGSNQSLSASGYQKLPGGLIIQWGGVSASVGGVSVTFPIAFPSACQSLQISSTNSAVTASLPLSASPPTTTGFTAYAASGAPGTRWLAIGY